MKTIFTLALTLCAFLTSFSQVDTTVKKEQPDTIQVGGMKIIRDPSKGNDNREITIKRRKYTQPARVSTNWFIFDAGFANYVDNTDYNSAEAKNFAPNLKNGKDDLKLKTWKSRNINIWIFMQKLNVAKHFVNLKYGLGLELNNYFFSNEEVRLQKNPTMIKIDSTLIGAKNKLAADYLTVPLMINFNFSPKKGNGFGFSAGLSAGYLYSARQKTKLSGHKNKLKNDFDLERFKLSYVGEIVLGPIKIFGSYAVKSMWSKGLDQRPYTVGIRFSNW
jgi:hypothetical protein